VVRRRPTFLVSLVTPACTYLIPVYRGPSGIFSRPFLRPLPCARCPSNKSFSPFVPRTASLIFSAANSARRRPRPLPFLKKTGDSSLFFETLNPPFLLGENQVAQSFVSPWDFGACPCLFLREMDLTLSFFLCAPTPSPVIRLPRNFRQLKD